MTEPLTASSFGAFNEFDAAAMAAAAAMSHHAVAKGAAAAAAVGAAPFSGQFGSVRFFDDVLGHSAVAAVNSLGPDYLGSFSPADTASGLALAGVGMSPSEAREVRESLAPRLVLSLNAAAAYGRDCYSTVADHGGSLGNLLKDVKEKGLVGVLKEGVVGGTGHDGGNRLKAADLVGSARVCATHSARDIIHCLGGVHVLFPLLAPIDRPGADNDAAAAELRDAIDLLAAMLEGSRLNQEALQVSGGFALIAHLLRRDGGRRLSAGAAVDGAACEERGKARVAGAGWGHRAGGRSASPGPSHVGRGERTRGGARGALALPSEARQTRSRGAEVADSPEHDCRRRG